MLTEMLPSPVAYIRGPLNQREKIASLWFEFRCHAQFASNVPRIIRGMEERAIRLGVREPQPEEPEPVRTGAPAGASYRWIELVDGVEDWFHAELGIGTKDDFFGSKNTNLRAQRIKQIARAAKEQAEDERREIIKKTYRT